MSESLTTKANIVIGTAGHIDHGKTSLVRALTGIDTDRLAEEKRRGISIDLGFAHMPLASGAAVSFIDVPGHERFIKNMLAGVGGIDAVLLVVAADESIKPQTVEHFEICRLLGVRAGLVAITKADLVAAGRIDRTAEDIRELVRGSFLEGAPIVVVSAHTGTGLNELRSELEKLVTASVSRDAGGFARLPIDRSFALRGFGTVVTGTLLSGRLNSGDSVEVYPARRALRIRGLQVHGKSVPSAQAGQRAAVNLAGVEAGEIQRGFVLASSGVFETTLRADAVIDWAGIADTDPATFAGRRVVVQVYSGTAEAEAGLKLLSRPADRPFLARLAFRQPMLLLPGDRFIIRQASPSITIAGGTVIDPFPPIRLRRGRTLERLRRLADADVAERVRVLVGETAQGRSLASLVKLTGLPEARLKELIGNDTSLFFAEQEQRVITHEWINKKQESTIKWLEQFHKDNPSVNGAALPTVRQAIFEGLEASLADTQMRRTPGVTVQADVVALTSHSASFSAREMEAIEGIAAAYRSAGFQPPELADVLVKFSLDAKKARPLVDFLFKSNRLVRISGEFVFHSDVLTHLRQSLAQQRGRQFSVPEFKDWTQVSRKFAIPLLEYLDRERVTRRDGDKRVVL
ncbi:MAG: selenocysteine-specific translation elongation factor [Bryobacteraceae bacterium]